MLNHFITHRKFGYGLPDSARLANMQGCILDHALDAWSRTGHFPNFVAVDFVDLGNAGATVEVLNALWEPTAPLRKSLIDTLILQPKDREIVMRFVQPTEAPFTLVVRDVFTGLEVSRESFTRIGITETILLGGPKLHRGEYKIELRMGRHFERRRLVLGR